MDKQFALFYHVWCPSEDAICRLVIDEQLKRIFRSGLINHVDIVCCIRGQCHEAARDHISQYQWIKINSSEEDNTKYEGATLEVLYDHCQKAKSLKGVGYVHTKGMRVMTSPASSRALRAINSWRHFLEWGIIDRWKDAVNELSRSDVVGVNYRENPWPHMGGNFWWARPSYIRGLVRPEVGRLPEGEYGFVVQTGDDRRKVIERLDFERWIGLKGPNVFSFYGYPFSVGGTDLPPEFHNLFEHDIEPYYREHSF